MAVVSPSIGLPVAPYDHPWDGRLARMRVLDWCKSKIQATPYEKNIDELCARRAFLLTRDSSPAYTREHWDLPYVDVIEDRLFIIPRGVKALGSGHGVIAVTKITESERQTLKGYTCQLYDRVRRAFAQMPECPFSPGKARSHTKSVKASLEASVEPIIITPSAEGTYLEINGQEIFIRASAEPIADDPDYDPSFALTAAIADPAHAWDASGAQTRLIAHCQNKGDGCWKQAYLVPGATPSASKFPVYDVINNELTIIPAALIAAAGRSHQAQGVDQGALATKICSLYSQVQAKYSNFPDCPLKKQSGPPTPPAKKAGPPTPPSQMGAAKKKAHPTPPMNPYARTAALSGLERKQIGRYNVPIHPPADWFLPPTDQPQFAMPLTITADGKVMGHGALWDSCHAGYKDKCVPVPRSAQDYKHFHRGAVQVNDGVLMAVGHLTVGGGHASPNAPLKAAAEHYDDASSTVAVVAAYEDRWGIYLAGSLVSDTDPEKVSMLLRSPLSGDWRNVDGNLELVAMHGVNVPGFGVDRPRVSVAASAEDQVPHSLIVVGCAQCQDEVDSRIASAASILEGKE